ncbi:MAG: MATE family efflux transporter [Candidatus Krumholzibacteriota bacterium]|nr:MATE family efflux transporter [Candidatus Krumholzibacteriota bacterium]
MKPRFWSILKTSVPIIVDFGAQVVMWTIEPMLVGHLAIRSMQRYYPGLGATGVDALTAVGGVVQVILFTCTILLTFVFGATILINRLLGEKKREEADHFLGQTLFTAMFPAFGIALIWYYLSPVIFRTLLGASPAVTAISVDYFRVLSWFAPFILMNFVAIGIVRGAGDTHLSMIVGLLVNGIHLVLAVCLIYGVWFFPGLGVRGAAYAAAIGHTTGFFFTYSVILRGKSVLTFKSYDFRSIKRSSIWRIIKTGTPSTLEQLAWMTGITIVIGFSNRLGPTAAAAHIVALTFHRLFAVMYLAFGMGALTLVGQRYGAKEYIRARQMAHTFQGIVLCVVIFLAAVIFFRAKYLAILFTTDPDVIPLCIEILKIIAIVQIPKAMSYILSFSLRGVGENRYPMYLAFGGVFLIEVLLGFNLAFVFGLSLAGLWIAAIIDEVLKVLLSARRFRVRIKSLIAGNTT